MFLQQPFGERFTWSILQPFKLWCQKNLETWHHHTSLPLQCRSMFQLLWVRLSLLRENRCQDPPLIYSCSDGANSTGLNAPRQPKGLRVRLDWAVRWVWCDLCSNPYLRDKRGMNSTPRLPRLNLYHKNLRFWCAYCIAIKFLSCFLLWIFSGCSALLLL